MVAVGPSEGPRFSASSRPVIGARQLLDHVGTQLAHEPLFEVVVALAEQVADAHLAQSPCGRLRQPFEVGTEEPRQREHREAVRRSIAPLDVERAGKSCSRPRRVML